MPKFLITGANGQVGYCLAQQLKNKAEILAVDHQQLDITNYEAVSYTIKAFRPDVVINAAAHTAVDRAETEIELSQAINAQGAQYLAEESKKIGALMLHISTDYVFDGLSAKPYSEEDIPNPQGVYGKTKHLGEIMVQDTNPRSIILRTSWVFGEHGNNFVKTMLRLGKEKEILKVVDDQIGGPTYAGDVAAALISIAEQILAGKDKDFGIYHFSGQPYVSWYEFAKSIFAKAMEQKIMGKLPYVTNIGTHNYPTPAKRPANSCLDLSKIKKIFGIEPSNWEKALLNLQDYSKY